MGYDILILLSSGFPCSCNRAIVSFLIRSKHSLPTSISAILQLERKGAAKGKLGQGEWSKWVHAAGGQLLTERPKYVNT